MRDRVEALAALAILSLAATACSKEAALPDAAATQAPISPTKNKLTINRYGHILWNGEAVSTEQLAVLLRKTAGLEPEPELQFQPDVDASYELSAKVLETIKDSKVTKFGFVGNEAYSASDAPSD